ncbi:reverse transcriptase family protein, partial [Klebsiella pneumoniae]|nr:reverse transcriptase family protein [Klebsiella pneumoniae]
DHVHTINQVIEKSAEYNRPLYMAFIDYEKAFDSVEIPAVLEALRRQGICDSYVNTIANIYKDSTATLLLHKKSRKIPIQKGVRQGDTISPMLFTACLEEIFKSLDWNEKGLRINGDYLSNLRFADDIVLFSNDGDELQKMIEDLSRESAKVGLRMNMQKTKIMFSGTVDNAQCHVASRSETRH